MNPALPERLPSWFRQEVPEREVFSRLKVISKFNLHTVCQEARCPNLTYCFKNKSLTFLILGDACTRNCRFCAVKKTEKFNLALDLEEPQRIAGAVKELALDYVVITSVTRDDLFDGGASIFSQTIKLIRAADENVKIEVLIPDFKGNTSSIKTVIVARPDIIAHNLETVSRLYSEVRPLADYRLSLELLGKIKGFSQNINTKSSLMLGLGESEAEVIRTLEDLRNYECDYLTLGQYLAPSLSHYPVKEFITPWQFDKYRKIALALGFKSVLSGPIVRSSYRAKRLDEYA